MADQGTMSLNDFMNLVGKWNDECVKVLQLANDEYAQDGSKFNNFHITAEIMNHVCPDLKGLVKPEHIVMIFQLKHLFSIWGGTSHREPMDGRYTDAINYLHLHRGVRRERQLQEEADGTIPTDAGESSSQGFCLQRSRGKAEVREFPNPDEREYLGAGT